MGPLTISVYKLLSMLQEVKVLHYPAPSTWSMQSFPLMEDEKCLLVFPTQNFGSVTARISTCRVSLLV